MDDGSMVAKVTELLDDTSTSTIADSAMRFSHNGRNERKSETNEETSKSGPQQALVLVGALLSLSVLIVILFIIADRFMKRTHWNRGKTTAIWKRRTVTEGSTHLPQKDVVKLGWIPAEDFDHWSTVLIPASLSSTSLSSLHLEGNRITALRAADFIGLRRLDQLHLASNVIVSIATGTFDQLTRLVRPF